VVEIIYLDRIVYYSDCSIELGPYDLPMKENIRSVIRIPSLGHAMAVFVNDEYIGKD
jgi:hypothetical protein